MNIQPRPNLTKSQSTLWAQYHQGSHSNTPPYLNHEVGYRDVEGIFASIFPSNFLLNHIACSQCIAPHSTLPTFLALQDLYVGLQPPNLFFLKVMTLLYKETQKNMTWLISKAKIAQYFTLFI